MPDMPKAPNPAKEAVSLMVSVAHLPKAGRPIRFDARPDELLVLARVLDIPAVRRMGADLLLSPWRADGISVTGRLEADVVQLDVVTLDELAQEVRETIDLVFVPEHSRLARVPDLSDGEMHLDPEGDDIPETFSGERIDVGALLTEALALGLDPYPRASTTVFEEIDTDPEPEKGVVSPFARLSELKPRGE